MMMLSTQMKIIMVLFQCWHRNQVLIIVVMVMAAFVFCADLKNENG